MEKALARFIGDPTSGVNCPLHPVGGSRRRYFLSACGSRRPVWENEATDPATGGGEGASEFLSKRMNMNAPVTASETMPS